MKLKKLLRNKLKVIKVVYYNFDYDLPKLNEYYTRFFEAYDNIYYAPKYPILRSFYFELVYKNNKKIRYSINVDSIDFYNPSKSIVLNNELKKSYQFAIINVKQDYKNYFNGILGLVHFYFEKFNYGNVTPLFLVDVNIKIDIFKLFSEMNQNKLTDNQFFHSIIFSPSECSEKVVKMDIELYNFIEKLRFFLGFSKTRIKEDFFICGQLFYFTFNNDINLSNFNYYCVKHIISKST